MPSWSTDIAGALAGHYWTLRPFVSRRYLVQHVARPLWSTGLPASVVPAAQRWTGSVEDERWGPIQLSGWLSAPTPAGSLLLVVHGLGGNAESPYAVAAVGAAAAAGVACFRLNLRGADGSGEDFYHAALTADLHAALASPALAGYSDIYVLGFSLGGHLALRLASEPHDPRVRAAAAVCSPIDLARSSRAIDRPGSAPYRHYVLRKLKQSYAEVARRRPVPTPLDRVRRIHTLRDWDTSTVVPRHGFASTDDYYERASAAGRLTALRVPALLVNTEFDPMVPASTVLPALPSQAPQLVVRWLKNGGHVGIPADVDLGEPAPLGIEAQVLHWLLRTGARAATG